MVERFSENFSKDMLEAVGHLTLSCAISEATLGTHLARLAIHPSAGQNQSVLLSAGMDLKVKLQNIETCVQLLFPDRLADVKKITSSIRRQFDHRNVIFHNISVQQGNELAIIRLRMGKDNLIFAKFFTASQIDGFATVLHGRMQQIGKMLTDLGVAPLAPPEEQQK